MARRVAPGHTMVELHSNFTVDGSKQVIDGVLPSNHAEHETLEITQGFNDWFETGFYVFTSIQPDGGWQWVGDHIRPRFRVPESWHWPVGVSLSQEIGYQRRDFSPDTWTWEIRPIVDKKIGRWYLGFNPALDRSFHGESVHKVSGILTQRKSERRLHEADCRRLGILRRVWTDYRLRSAPRSAATIFPDHRFGPRTDWEFNFGVGVGTIASTDHLIINCIVGRRFSWTHGK